MSSAGTAKFQSGWVGADIGGTFTDVVVRGTDGTIRFEKRLSTPEDYSEAVVEGIEQVGGSDSFESLGALNHATTVATNAVLEERGARVGLITTAGFRDVLEFGRLQRDDLYDLNWQKPKLLVPRNRRREVVERIGSDGAVLTELNEQSLQNALSQLIEDDVEVIAVCLINSYVNPEHEIQIRDFIKHRCTIPVVLSTELLRECGEFERMSTSVVNAYILDIIADYLECFVRRLSNKGCSVEPSIMQSSGGTIGVATAQVMPVRMIESGPAAGVIAAASLATAYELDRAISFDMGGTTAKACLIEKSSPSMSDEYWVGASLHQQGSRLLRGRGYPIRVPTIDIAEVSSGGGSIAWVDEGGALKVGPRSAGASPGPACYGLGGEEPTFTDSCVVLGIFDRDTIGSEGIVIDRELARGSIKYHIADPLGISIEEAANGIYNVTISNLMRTIRAVTVEVGKDPRDYSLIAFGGAGGMVAAELASQLGIDRVIIPPLPGVFSALGLLVAPILRSRVVGVFRMLSSEILSSISIEIDNAEKDIENELSAEGHATTSLSFMVTLDIHYRGQGHSISVDWPTAARSLDPDAFLETLRLAFQRAYERLHAHLREDSEIEVVAIRVTGSLDTQGVSYGEIVSGIDWSHSNKDQETERKLTLFGNEDISVQVFDDRNSVADLSQAVHVIIQEPDSTIYIPKSFECDIDPWGGLDLRIRSTTSDQKVVKDKEVTATSLEIFANGLATVNDEMTSLIARTAQSEIAKDVLDFATALCDTEGRVVSQGLTMVLHAGAIPAAIDFLKKEHGDDFKPGEVFITNDPYLGGSSHLVDIFLIRPIFADGTHIGFAGCVVHTSDMGGRVAGGNAADSTEIFQEGLRLPPTRIVENDTIIRPIERIIEVNVRVPGKVLGDMHALIQACQMAERRLQEIVLHKGHHHVLNHMQGLIDHATRLFLERIQSFPDGRFSFEDVLDDDGVGNGPIKIAVTIQRVADRLVVDFDGTDPAVPGATNSPWPFTESAALYAIKAVLGADIPNNSGYFDLIDVRFPPSTVVNPSEPTATAAKGVVAFRVVDALFGALAQALPGKVPAAGDGGAAIVVFAGREEAGPFVAVDVVMSAWGGRSGMDGIDGISSSAVNGRNTPIEVLEASYPLRILAYELVPATGGFGEYRGGLATRRVYEYTGANPATLQVRSDRNPTKPWGLMGGEPGATSLNSLVNPEGDRNSLATKVTITIQPHSVFEHLTASGGGYGSPRDRDPEAICEDVLTEKLMPDVAERSYGWKG